MGTSGPGIELVADSLGLVANLAGLHSDIPVHDGVGPGMDRLENNPSPCQEKKQDPHERLTHFSHLEESFPDFLSCFPTGIAAIPAMK